MPILAYQTHTGTEALNGQVGWLLGARTLRELYAVGRNWVGKQLETDPSRHQVLLLIDPGEGEPCVMVIDDRSLNRNESYKLFRIPRDWSEQLSGTGGPLALERAIDLLGASEVPWLTEKLGAGPGLLLRLRADGRLRGAWWAPLRSPVARGGIETIELAGHDGRHHGAYDRPHPGPRAPATPRTAGRPAQPIHARFTGRDRPRLASDPVQDDPGREIRSAAGLYLAGQRQRERPALRAPLGFRDAVHPDHHRVGQ